MTNGYLVRLDRTDPNAAVLGSTCERCAYHCAPATRRCPHCGGRSRPARFVTRGRVWSASTVHIAVGEFPSSTFTYVDLDDGPRVLVRSARPPSPVGSAVELLPTGEQGIEVVPCG